MKQPKQRSPNFNDVYTPCIGRLINIIDDGPNEGRFILEKVSKEAICRFRAEAIVIEYLNWYGHEDLTAGKPLLETAETRMEVYYKEISVDNIKLR